MNPIAATFATLRAQFLTRARAQCYEIAGWALLLFVDWRIAAGLAVLQVASHTRLKAAAMGGGL